MEYTYEDFKGDLEIGHEFHFLYKGKKYSISHSQDGVHLSEFYREHQTFRSAEEFLNGASINGFPLNEIWIDIQVTTIF